MPPPTVPIGIDVGAKAIHVATSFEQRVKPAIVSLEAQDWHEQLARLVPPGSVVALEPTGWHYSAPVITALAHIGAQVIMVEHRITGLARELRISGAKKDITDAQTLCYIAAKYKEEGYRGVRPATPEDESKVIELRLLVRAQIRAQKESVRGKNRLRQLAHSIWPAISQSLDTYLRAVQHGHITPDELRGLSLSLRSKPTGAKWPTAYNHGQARNALYNLAESLPPWLQSHHARAAIEREAAAQVENERRADELESLIAGMIHEPPFEALTELWETVPRSGPVSIAAVHAATHGHAERMKLAQFKAAVGSHPKTSQSGETSQTKMARQGYKPTRAVLTLWAMNLIKHGENPIAAIFEQREAHRRKNNLHAARGKLAEILWAIARSGQPYYDPQKGRQP